MKVIQSVQLSLFAATALAVSIPLKQERDVAQFPVSGNGYITYRGPITPNGEHHVINGSVTTILQQIKTLNPAFDPADWPHLVEAKAKNAAKLEKRSKEGATNCGAFGYAFLEGGLILPVSNLPGNCEIGPRTCEQLTCFEEDGQNNAMTFCNDNDHSISPSCSYLASYGTDIGEACDQDGGEDPPGTFLQLVGGQEFDTDGYNIIIGRPDSCDNPVAGGGSATCNNCS